MHSTSRSSRSGKVACNCAVDFVSDVFLDLLGKRRKDSLFPLFWRRARVRIASATHHHMVSFHFKTLLSLVLHKIGPQRFCILVHVLSECIRNERPDVIRRHGKRQVLRKRRKTGCKKPLRSHEHQVIRALCNCLKTDILLGLSSSPRHTVAPTINLFRAVLDTTKKVISTNLWFLQVFFFWCRHSFYIKPDTSGRQPLMFLFDLERALVVPSPAQGKISNATDAEGGGGRQRIAI
mmetsp:Transcript_15854/g.34544  ORF Transcript_15854/g.34544 Transcript_15854/m.34544 type:complete len:236 (+) Transcript_15854:64-771(+)